MVRINRSTALGADITVSAGDMGAMRAQFEHQHCVHLPGFLEPELYRQIAAAIDVASFERRDHSGIGSEECMVANAVLARLHFLANDPRLFEAIEEISGCGPIGCFSGRVYRMSAGDEDYDSWHTDCGDQRLIAMSVNLGREPYHGGALEIRDDRLGRIVHTARNHGPGDAMVFRIARGLSHRVTPLEEGARTAFAGWFKSSPSFRSMLHPRGEAVGGDRASDRPAGGRSHAVP